MAEQTLDQFTAATARPGILSLAFLRDADLASPQSRAFTLQLLMEAIQDGATVKSMALSSPTALTPAKGDTYIVSPTGAGAWAGNDNAIAIYDGSAWVFSTPAEGWKVYDQNLNQTQKYTGSAWTLTAGTEVAFDDTVTGLTATTVQGAIDQVASVFAALRTEISDAATLGSIGTTAQVMPFVANPINEGMTVSLGSNTVTVPRDGIYEVDLVLCLSTVASGDSGLYTWIIQKNSTDTYIEMQRSMSGTSDTGSVTCAGFLDLEADDVIRVTIASDNGSDADDINIINASLIVKLIRGS